jgi:L-lactate dehydrogenase complex protein LldG
MEEREQLRLIKARADAVQTSVADVKSLQEAFQYAIDLTRNQGGSSIAAPQLEPQALSQLASQCQQADITLLTENLRDHIGRFHTGFTLCDWGIAETATLVLDSTSEDVRLATMLSETHVAVLPRPHIKSDAMELESELSATMKAAPRYLAFISGASRTADIERVLTIGVHGPQELHLLILDEGPD